jgi:hypothetical protein
MSMVLKQAGWPGNRLLPGEGKQLTLKHPAVSESPAGTGNVEVEGTDAEYGSARGRGEGQL